MEKLVETLQQHFAHNPPDYGDAESVLGILYEYYMEHGSSDSEKIMSQFATLRALVNLPLQEYDPIFYVVSDLCMEHGRLAFSEGLRMGMELTMEAGHGKVVSGK